MTGKIRWWFCVLALLAALPGGVRAQRTSGSISGRVLDEQGNVLPGAEVALTHQQTGAVQSVTSGDRGLFVFASVLPGSYTVTIRLQSFRELRRPDIQLTAADSLALGDLVLQVGAIAETVTIEAAPPVIQTSSAERSALIDTKQLAALPSLGRDAFALMRTLPGTVYEGNGSTTLGQAGIGVVNGMGDRYGSINLDGVTANTRQVAIVENPLNLDAVSEIKIQTANYRAEHGKQAGAIVTVVTKGGTQQFHGAGYYYKRDEALNANNFFNNMNGVEKPRYRFNTTGYNVGGPIFWKGFNTKKDKLFFFFSQELQPSTTPNGIRRITVPTALERQGDFSQSIESNGSPRIVRDPLTGQPFPGNRIPQDRINPSLQRLLNMFPLPNFTDTGVSRYQYNYVSADSNEQPVNQAVVRVDYVATPKWRFFGRYMDMTVKNTGRCYVGLGFVWDAGTCGWWSDGQQGYNTRNPNVAFNVSTVIRPNMVNDLTIGAGRWFEKNQVDDALLRQFNRETVGFALGQFYPSNNPGNLLPSVYFNGVPSAVAIDYDPRFPMDNGTRAFTINENLTIVSGAHTLKAGLLFEHSQYSQPHSSGSAPFTGRFTFASGNANNPFDSGYAFANALLGNFDSYVEPTARPDYFPIVRVLEWFAQDTWRVSNKLSIDLGARFTADLTPYTKGHNAANFVPGAYDPSRTPRLFEPARDGSGRRVARNPITGELQPEVFIGRIVPGSGDVANGAVLESGSFFEGQGVQVAPRVGFSYDPFGDGRTAIRGGAGIYYNMRLFPGELGGTAFNPPVITYPTQFYGNASTFLGSGGLLTPSNYSTAVDGTGSIPRLYHLSLGAQRDIGFRTVVDIAYVGTISKNEPWSVNINTVPFGARFLPQNQDPTTGRPLPDNFFRPIPGIGNIPMRRWGSSSSYHSLQLQMNRRFAHNFQFGAAYTWSKALTYGSTLPLYLDPRRNYGPSGADRRHIVSANWVWDLPDPQGGLARQALGGWMLSGILQISSGAPLQMSFSTADGADVLGGGDAGRMNVTGDPRLSGGSRTLQRWFDPGVFARPGVGDIGNAALTPIIGPGITNLDLVLFKDFSLFDRAKLQFRWELYNALNHTQWSSVDTAARFDASGQQINPNFGRITGAREPRIMQGALRVTF